MRLTLVFCLLVCASLQAKVRVLTCHYNEPSFIELQYKCAKKFLLDDHELIVFNDARTLEDERGIQEVCEKLGIKCVRFQPEWHETDDLNAQVKNWVQDPSIQKLSFVNIPLESLSQQPSLRHSHVLQYALDQYGYDHDDAVIILDGDAFFIRPTSVKNKLKSFDLFGLTREVKQDRAMNYLWVPFVVFDPTALPDVKDLKFHVAVVDQILHDTGAASENYLRAHPHLRCEKLGARSSHQLRRRSDRELKAQGYSENERWLIRELPRVAPAEFNIENGILHFRAVSFSQPGHDEKAKCLSEFMKKIL